MNWELRTSNCELGTCNWNWELGYLELGTETGTGNWELELETGLETMDWKLETGLGIGCQLFTFFSHVFSF